MNLALSVLDLVPLTGQSEGAGASTGRALRNSLELARLADRLGYTRYWFAEHHNLLTIASTTPEILIALAGDATTRMHVGSGGVMLPNHAPLKVAEAFKMLEALHPGRVDLGVGRAPGTDQLTALALRSSREALGADNFPAQLAELRAYGGEGVSTSRASRQGLPDTIVAVPKDVSLPPIWLLGSSDYSAHLAAQLGLGFGFAAHFSDYPPELPMRIYRDEFRAGAFPRPHAILTLSVICAPTDDEAERLLSSLLVAFARLRTGQSSMLLPPEQALAYEFSAAERAIVDSIRGRHIAGSPDHVKRQIEEIAMRTRADEVMVSTFIYGHEERKRSYELLAEVFSLPHLS